MFEVIERAGLARTGAWEFCGWKTKTPNILFIHTDRFQAPKIAEIYITNKKISEKADKPCIVDSGSFFNTTSDMKTENTIPTDIHYPFNYSDKTTERTNGTIQILREDSIVNRNAELYILANAPELFVHPRDMVKRIYDIREKIGYNKLIYTPGLGTPEQLAILAYCGVDLFDSILLILYARNGDYLFPNGKMNKDDISDIPCHCPACISSHGSHSFDTILAHNYHIAYTELKNIRHAVEKGTIRELTEYRSRSHPDSIALLRLLDLNYYEFQEKYLPLIGSGIFSAGKESLIRPEVTRFRTRVKDRWRKSPLTDILLLLPCSAKKPYSESITHKALHKTVIESRNPEVIQEVIVTSPLGLVPKELERFYPACNYDIPVTGHWDMDEKYMITESIEGLIKNNEFRKIVIMLPHEMNFVGKAIEKSGLDAIQICSEGERPTDDECLRRLYKTLVECTKGSAKISFKERMLSDIISMARFQFGNIGEKLVNDTEFKGRYPYIKIFGGGSQLCSYSPDRNMFALTPEGSGLFLKDNSYLVAIDDFKPQGDIMAVGVIDADPLIRIGDDVVITDKNKNEIIGTGIARMSSSEMICSKRGVAVKTRQLVNTK